MIAAVGESFQARLERLRGLVRSDLLDCLAGLSPCVLGIDADSQRLGWCALDGNTIKADTIARTNRAGEIDAEYDARLAALMGEACARRAGVILEGVWLASESSSAVRNVQVFRLLAEVQGEIKAAARANGVLLTTVSPTQWHTAVLGFTHGRVELKRASAELARALTGGEDLSQHESDAVAIVLYGAARMFWQEGQGREVE